MLLKGSAKIAIIQKQGFSHVFGGNRLVKMLFDVTDHLAAKILLPVKRKVGRKITSCFQLAEQKHHISRYLQYPAVFLILKSSQGSVDVLPQFGCALSRNNGSNH